MKTPTNTALDAARRLCGGDTDRLRVLVNCQGVERADDLLVQVLSGVNPERDGLSAADHDAVACAFGLLDGMVADGLLARRTEWTRECVRYYYRPVGELAGRTVV